ETDGEPFVQFGHSAREAIGANDDLARGDDAEWVREEDRGAATDEGDERQGGAAPPALQQFEQPEDGGPRRGADEVAGAANPGAGGTNDAGQGAHGRVSPCWARALHRAGPQLDRDRSPHCEARDESATAIYRR